MPTIVNVPTAVFVDGAIVMNLEPATSISGASLRFDLMKRFGSTSPFYQAFSASGLDGVSGITVLNGLVGQFKTNLPAYVYSGIQQSGFDSTGPFAIRWMRTDSGQATNLGEGFLLSYP